MSMKLDPPAPDRVVRELKPALRAIYTAIDASIQRTVDFFDGHGQPVDASLAPNLVRYYAKQQLDSLDLKTEFDYDRHELGNNGLLLTAGIHQLRILKSDDGHLPVPGKSTLKQKFYQQPLPLFGRLSEGDPLPALRLVVLWDALPGSYAFQGLALALPKNGGETRASVEIHWLEPIEEKLLLAVTGPAPIDEDDTGEEDLPIRALQRTKTANSEGDPQ